MRSKKFALGFVLVLALLGSWAAIRERRALQAQTLARVMLERDVTEGRRHLQAAQKTEAGLAEKIRALGPKAGTAAKAELTAKAQARAEVLAAGMNHRTQIMLAMNLELGVRPEFEKLGLSPEQWEKYSALAIERGLSVTDARGAAHRQGLTGTEYQAAVRAVAAAVDDQIREVVGAQAYQQLQDYNRRLPLQQEVESLANGLRGSDISLTDDQEKQLTQLLLNGQAAVPSDEEGPFFIPEALAGQARGILSPEQFASWSRQVTARQLLHQTDELSGGPAVPKASQ